MEDQKNKNQPDDIVPGGEDDSLEAPTTSIETSPASTNDTPPSLSKAKSRIKTGNRFLDRFNIYLLLFILIVIIAAVITGISAIQSNRSDKKANKITTEPLSQEALDQLRQTDVKIGDPKQILTVESNAIFAGRVLIRGSLEVAGEIRAGTSMTAPDLTVPGNTNLNEVRARNLQLAGNASIQGQVAIQNNLAVSGSGTFGGTLSAASLNIQNLQINGDVQFTRHIRPGGGIPSKSDGSALGNGGTSSISGSDTAGTITINTGGSPAPGCFITINFTQRFNDTPHIVITPVGPGAANLNYYIQRSASNFSVCSTNAAPAAQNFAFDYVAIN